MNRIKFYLTFWGLVMSLHLSLSASFESDPAWSDEFRFRFSVNPNNWNIEESIWENELESYLNSDKNCYCSWGILHLKTIKEDSKGKKCTSARINTKDKIQFLYGKIDVRAKAPIGKGIFPAIWMLPLDWTRPYGELDFMEYIDCWEGKHIQSNVHVVYELGVKHYQHPNKVNLDVDQWHVYSLEWYKDKLVYLIDEVVIHQVLKSQLEAWPFDRPYYLLLNVAFGGWGGTCGVDYDILPKEMLVDYVRYYKLKE